MHVMSNPIEKGRNDEGRAPFLHFLRAGNLLRRTSSLYRARVSTPSPLARLDSQNERVSAS